MITLALPWVFGVAMAGALAVTALHMLSVRRPPERLLPTSRFLPDRAIRAVSRTSRPSDVLLLVVRIAILVAAGLAAARPAWRSATMAHVVLVVSDRGVARDTLALRALIVGAGDTVPATTRFAYAFVDNDRSARDEPAAVYPVAWRTASQLAATDAAVDSFELHLVWSRQPDERDAGLIAWRGAWPGRVSTHAPMASTSVPRRVRFALERAATLAGDDDVVQSAFAWHAARRPTFALRDSATPTVRVIWPPNGVPIGWHALPTVDSVVALVTGGQALMGPWPVTAVPETSTSAAIAWWSDGRVAATERRTATGCDREVAVVSAPSRDALLSASAMAFFDRLLAPCRSESPATVSGLIARHTDGTSLAAASAFRSTHRESARPSTGMAAWIAPVLYALALLLLVAEWRVRERWAEVVA